VAEAALDGNLTAQRLDDLRTRREAEAGARSEFELKRSKTLPSLSLNAAAGIANVNFTKSFTSSAASRISLGECSAEHWREVVQNGVHGAPVGLHKREIA